MRDLQKHFSSGAGSILDRLPGTSEAGPVRAVDGVSFDLRENETLGVVGESGCRKSTMGKSILRLLEPTSGEIRYRGESITDASKGRLRELRQELQMIFQDPGSALNPRMKVKHLVGEPIENFESLSHEALDRRTDELLERVDLPTTLKERYPHELSGGQQQQVIIAGAIALDPKQETDRRVQ